MLGRAYSLIELKSVDEEQRIIEGIATTPTPDRVGDVIDPKGAAFNLPIPLLWQHRGDSPIGRVLAATVTDAGIRIRAQIEKGLLPEIDRAWALIKSGLVRGLSIGFKGLESEPIDPKDPFWGGQKYLKWEWLELSAVTIPANGDASIQSVKSLAAEELATLRERGSSSSMTPGVTGTRVVHLTTPKVPDTMKTISERKQAFVAEKAAKVEKLNTLMPEDGGKTLDGAEKEAFDTIAEEIKSIDDHLARLETLEQVNRKAAMPVVAGTPQQAAESRSGAPVITVRDPLPKGIAFARLAMVTACAHMDHRYVNDVAKQMFPHDDRLSAYLQHKATVLAGTTTNAVYAAALVDPTNLTSEFVEFLTPMTILGQFGTNGIPDFTRVPFNVRIPRQTSIGEAYWVPEGAAKPVSGHEFDAVTILFNKVATISVLTKELVRFSQPNAETLVRNSLARSIARRLDIDFVDPAFAAVAATNPASITNGLTALTSAGTSADNARTDIGNLLETFITNNVDPTSLVLIMPNTLALALSLMVNSLGNPEFPGLTMRGGSLLGIPVIASQYAANASGGGNLVIAINATDLLVADDRNVTIDMSTEASLQMLDNPTNNSATGTPTTVVSLWQTNSVGLRAEREITWLKARSTAVAYMDDVNWGSIGSPS